MGRGNDSGQPLRAGVPRGALEDGSSLEGHEHQSHAPDGDFVAGFEVHGLRSLAVDPCAITTAQIVVSGEVDYFKFDAENGATYMLSVSPETLQDVHVFVWRTAGREIKLQEVRGVGPASVEFAWTAPFSGPVFISVESYSEATGTYEFAIGSAP